jgi:hypothetical protein
MYGHGSLSAIVPGALDTPRNRGWHIETPVRDHLAHSSAGHPAFVRRCLQCSIIDCDEYPSQFESASKVADDQFAGSASDVPAPMRPGDKRRKSISPGPLEEAAFGSIVIELRDVNLISADHRLTSDWR